MNDAPAPAKSTPRFALPVLPLWSWPIIGGVSALGFAPQDWWPLTVIAFALLIAQSARVSVRQAFWIGWLFGLGHFTVGLRWIAVAFTYQAAMPEWLGYLGVVLLSVYLAVYPALTAMAARKLSGGRLGLPHVLAFAGFWIITEYARSQMFTGFAWNPLSIIAVDIAGAAKQMGTYGLSGLLLIGMGGVALLANRQWKGGRYGFGQVLLVDGKLLISAENGDLLVVATNENELEELHRFPAIKGKTLNNPAIAHGFLLLRNSEEMVCYNLSL